MKISHTSLKESALRRFALLATGAVLIVTTSALTTHAQNRGDRRGTDGQQRVTKEQRIASWLSRMDSNNDGKIALNESSGQMKANFRRNDANGDGFIDMEELGNLADRLSGTAARSRNPNTGPARPILTNEQVMGRVPDGVTVELDISYRKGNDAWKLDLAMPRKTSDKPRPAIVVIHSGGWVRGDKRWEQFLDLALNYATKGYVCVTVNYRLDATKLPCIEDVKCAVRWLRAHPRSTTSIRNASALTATRPERISRRCSACHTRRNDSKATVPGRISPVRFKRWCLRRLPHCHVFAAGWIFTSS